MKFFSKIFKNKSMVTLKAMIVCLAILYFAYNYRVNKAIDAIDVPIATRKIPARDPINAEDIKTKKVARAMITDNVIRDKKDLEGKYVNYNTFIPEGSVFYKSGLPLLMPLLVCKYRLFSVFDHLQVQQCHSLRLGLVTEKP